MLFVTPLRSVEAAVEKPDGFGHPGRAIFEMADVDHGARQWLIRSWQEVLAQQVIQHSGLPGVEAPGDGDSWLLAPHRHDASKVIWPERQGRQSWAFRTPGRCVSLYETKRCC